MNLMMTLRLDNSRDEGGKGELTTRSETNLGQGQFVEAGDQIINLGAGLWWDRDRATATLLCPKLSEGVDDIVQSGFNNILGRAVGGRDVAKGRDEIVDGRR